MFPLRILRTKLRPPPALVCHRGILKRSVGRWEPNSFEQITEAQITAKRIHERHTRHIAHTGVVLVNRLLQPLECMVLISESAVDGSDRHWGNKLCRRQHLQRRKNSSWLIPFARSCVA